MELSFRILAGTFQLAILLALSIIGIPVAILVLVMGLMLFIVSLILIAIPALIFGLA